MKNQRIKYQAPHQYDVFPSPKCSNKSPEAGKKKENSLTKVNAVQLDPVDPKANQMDVSNNVSSPPSQYNSEYAPAAIDATVENSSTLTNVTDRQYLQDYDDRGSIASSGGASLYFSKEDNFFKNKLSLIDEVVYFKFVLRTHKNGYLLLLIPLILFVCLVTTGVVIVFEQRGQDISGKESIIQSNAYDAADFLIRSFDASLQPLNILRGVIRQEYNASKVVPKFQNGMAAEALSVSMNTAAALQLAPNGVINSIYPLKGNEKGMGHQLFQSATQFGVFNGTTYQYPNRRNDALATVNERNFYLVGPFKLVQGYNAIIARLPVFVADVDMNETFGQSYDIMSFDCSICYNVTTREKVWGLLISVLYWDELKERLLDLEYKLNYRFELSSVVNNQKVVILKSTRPVTYSSHFEPVTVQVHNLDWVLIVENDDSLEPIWVIPIIIVIVVFSLTVSLLTMKILLNDKHRELLLHAILPPKVLVSMKEGEQYVEEFKHVAVLFTDIVGFTEFSASISPKELARFLHELYTEFDQLVTKHQVFKVETIGDAFVCCCGCPYPESMKVSARRIVSMALDMIHTVNNFVSSEGHSVQIRAGVHIGPIVGCVMGHKSPRFCLVGDTMNTASRMESNSEAMRVNCSHIFASVLRQCDNLGANYKIESRGILPVKGKGDLEMFWISQNYPMIESNKPSSLTISLEDGNSATSRKTEGEAI